MTNIPPQHEQALALIYARLANSSIWWLITGSVGMALQGMDLTPHDIDLQTDRAGVHAIAELLAEYLVQPAGWKESPHTRSEYALLEINGVQVEVIGDVSHRRDDGDWYPAPDISMIRRWVDHGTMRLPVADLEYECESYARMGRLQKSQAIRAFLNQRKAGVTIRQIGPEELDRYASVPIAFTVRSRLIPLLVDDGLGGIRLVEEPVEEPYLKDYDADDQVTGWPEMRGVREWAFFLAEMGERPVGGAAVMMEEKPVHLIGTRRDLATLWDIRVHPDSRGRGMGGRLLRAAEDWAREHGCRQMKIETQNVNVEACRFYARQGAKLGAIDRFGYADPKYASETMLLWYKDL